MCFSSHTSHTSTIAAWFNLKPGAARRARFDRADLPVPRAGEILLITGASGSGKSSLLRFYQRKLRPGVLHLDRLPLPNRAVVDLFPGLSLEAILRLLSRVGLAEAHTYLSRPRQLSDGQRWRLRLALALHAAHGTCAEGRNLCLLADEFAALLDPLTAWIIARTLRRAITQTPGLCAILATNRPDLLRPLAPDRVVRCDFGVIHTGETHANRSRS